MSESAAVEPAEPLRVSMHRFVRIATAAMDAPLATIALVRDDLQVAVGRAGRHAPVRRRAPLLARPLCEAVIASAAPIIVEDVHADAHWREVVDDAEVGAFIGVPLLRHDGLVLGGLAAIDGSRRSFSPADLDVLYDVGGAITDCLDARDLAEALALRRRRSPTISERRCRPCGWVATTSPLSTL